MHLMWKDFGQSAQDCAKELYEAYISNNQEPINEHKCFWEYYEKNIASDIEFINI